MQIPSPMKRPLLSLIVALALLLTQWGLLAHELGGHDHQQGHVCELCVHANAHQAVLPATKLVMPQDHGHAPYLGTNQTQDLPFIAERGQPIRAPPALLLT